MARCLGVSCKKDEVMFAIADGDLLVEDSNHERVKAPALLEATEGMRALADDVKRVLAEVQPDVVRILLPEQTYEASYPQLAPRVAMETLVRLACLEASVPVETLYPNSVRARVGMPSSGKFDDHIGAVIPEPVGRYWTAGRRRAAVVALAERE